MYCDQALVGNDLPGLKGFVVRFMIHMSRVSVMYLIYYKSHKKHFKKGTSM